MDPDHLWSTRLGEMANELDRIERQVSADDVSVRTHQDKTIVTLTYEHEDPE